MATRTCANAGGNWSALATWVEGAVPTAADDVVFTATSGNLTIDTTANCRSLDFTGYVGVLTWSSQTINIGTSSLPVSNIALKQAATYSISSVGGRVYNFVSTVTGGTITAGTVAFPQMAFNGAGGGWTFQDAFSATSLTVTAGTLNSNNVAISGLTGSTAITVNGGTLNLGSSAVTIASPTGILTYTSGTLNAGTSTITCTATSGTPSINTGTASLANLTINGSGTAVTVAVGGQLNCTGNVTLTVGTLNTNGQTCSWGTFVTGTGTGTGVVLSLGASNITLTGGGSAFNIQTSSLMTLNAGTSTITFSAVSVLRATTGPYTFNSVVYSAAGTNVINPTNGFTFANVTVAGSAAKTNTFNLNVGGTLTITSSLTLNASGSTQGVNRLLVQCGSVGTQRTLVMTGATVNISGDVDFMDVSISGSPTWNNTGSAYIGDAGGNGGAVTTNVTTPAAQTWNANTTGTWSTAANWTSRVPLPQDNVAINALTSGSISLDMPRLAANIVCTGSTGGTLTPSVNTTNYGNLTLAAGMTAASGGSWAFAGRGNQTITCNGVVFAPTPSWNMPGGTYTLVDNFICNVAPGSNLAVFFNGTLTAQANVTLPRFSFNQTHTAGTTLNMGPGNWTIYGTGVVWSSFMTNFTLNPQTSTIVISDTSSTGKTFAGGQTYNNLTINGAVSAAAVTVTGTNTFNTITGQANAHLSLTSVTTTTVSSLTSLGTAGALFVLDAVTPGSAATLSSTNRINTDYISVKDSTASGNTPFYAGTHGVLVSGDTNWLAQAAPSLGGTLPLMGVG